MDYIKKYGLTYFPIDIPIKCLDGFYSKGITRYSFDGTSEIERQDGSLWCCYLDDNNTSSGVILDTSAFWE